MKVKAKSGLEKRGRRVLRQTEAVPRFRQARRAKALIDAIKYGDSGLAVWFLKQGFDPDATDGKGRSALWWASALRRSDVIGELVKRAAPLPDGVLFGPVDEGDERIVRLLVRKGANVNCIGSPYSPVGYHNTSKHPLLAVAIGGAAASHRKESIPIMLVRAGAEVDRLILECATDGMENRSMLGLAAYYGLLRTVRAMIAAGADVNIRDNRGGTALIDALSEGHVTVARALLKAGAAVNVTRKDGVTPAAAAAARNLRIPGLSEVKATR
jgi:uncharacterized protein